MRSILNSAAFPSDIYRSHEKCDKVQDAYSLRCSPQVRTQQVAQLTNQVHGVVHDVIEFSKGILTTELNSATDNPMVFTKEKSKPN